MIHLNNHSNTAWDDFVRRVVIHTTDYLSFDGGYSAGGRQRHIRDLAGVIRDVWHKDVLIVQKGENDFQTKCNNGFTVLGLKSDLSAKGDPLFAYKVRKILKENDGVLYASGEDAWPFFIPGAKAVQHGVWWDGPQSMLTRMIQAHRVLKCLESIRSMLCVDTNFINWLRCQGKRGFALTPKCTYVPNYADLSHIKVSSKNNGSRLRLVCARRYEEKRGIDIFVDALARLKSKSFPFTAHISAPGGLPQVRSRVDLNGLSSSVTVSEDDMDAVFERYFAADVAVVPTIWSEGTSLSCVEALCAGLPVVTTPVGGLGNLVIPGFNGFVVNPSPDSISNAVMCFANPDLLREMKSNCLSMRNALGKKNWESQVLKWLKD